MITAKVLIGVFSMAKDILEDFEATKMMCSDAQINTPLSEKLNHYSSMVAL